MKSHAILFMETKPKKRIVPTLVSQASAVNNTNNKAFEAAAQKKNPLENAADMIAMRYGISTAEAPVKKTRTRKLTPQTPRAKTPRAKTPRAKTPRAKTPRANANANARGSQKR